jgi:hypothetical protein
MIPLLHASNNVRKMQRLIEGQFLTRRDIAVLFGGNARAFLPRVPGGEVVAGCFDPAMNPRAPAEILVHNAPNAVLAAKRFVEQSRIIHRKNSGIAVHTTPGAIPVFIKLEPNVWEYIGRFRAIGYETDPAQVEARIYEIRPRIYEKYVRAYGEMKGILFLEEASF